MKLLFIILRSIIYVPLFILLFGWIALNVRGYDRQIGLVLPLWTRPIGIIIMIAAATISFQIMKTATTNPAETIKYE